MPFPQRKKTLLLLLLLWAYEAHTQQAAACCLQHACITIFAAIRMQQQLQPKYSSCVPLL
jgi:hypothetical protein